MKAIKKFLFKKFLSFIDTQTRTIQAPLTEDDLINLGWIRIFDDRVDKYYFIEPNIKERDKIWIEFEHHYYRVWHGRDKTFIALKINKEWFDVYYMLHKQP